MSLTCRALASISVGLLLATPGRSLAAEPTTDWRSAAVGAAATPSLAGDVDWSLTATPPGSAHQSRGLLLPSLYVALAALNAFDAYTTASAISNQAGREANPLMRGVARQPVALWAVKGAATAASVALADGMWRRNNRVGAIATMLATNSLVAVVSAHNARVARSRR